VAVEVGVIVDVNAEVTVNVPPGVSSTVGEIVGVSRRSAGTAHSAKAS
jgi:hypothetical protein